MKKYNCEYRDGHKLNIGDNWEKKGILANNHKEAYEKFIQEVGIYPKLVTVSFGLFGESKEFDDHIEAENQRIIANTNTEDEQSKTSESDATKQNINLTTQEQLLQKIVDNQNKQTEVLNRVHWEQNEQTGALNKIRWAIIALLIFIVGQWIALKMKWGL